jgi:hypothetical protein
MFVCHALLCLTLTACSTPGTSRGTTGDRQVAPAQEPADRGCVEGVQCARGDHWEPTLCRCAPDEDAAIADARPDVCVERALCVRTAHWDPELCQCVSNQDEAVDAGADGSGCNKHALCFAGYHWEATSCSCVQDDGDGGLLAPDHP